MLPRLAWIASIASTCLVACGGHTPAASSVPPDYRATCHAIARDLETLTRQYPQLASYRAIDSETGDRSTCTISYDHHTHRSMRAGGWTAAVPNPDPDGIWLHIGIWDPADPGAASSQINTQPLQPPWMIGERRVTFLILEGEAIKPASAAIERVLRRHGMHER